MSFEWIAEPTKPSAPDGETRVDVTLIARDVSDFEGKEVGVSKVSFTFRDPLGNDHGYQTGNSTMNHPELDKTRSKSGYDGISEWKAYDFNFTLPKGSPPGKWGMLEAYVTDKAGNTRKYSFVEYVRFDVIESDIKLTSPLKIEIIEALWKIIYSNKNADIYETNLMRRLTGLLYIDSKIIGNIKEKVKKEFFKWHT